MPHTTSRPPRYDAAREPPAVSDTPVTETDPMVSAPPASAMPCAVDAAWARSTPLSGLISAPLDSVVTGLAAAFGSAAPAAAGSPMCARSSTHGPAPHDAY